MAFKEKNIFDYVYIFLKWQKFILKCFLIVCLIVTIFSLLLPRWFTAHTTILPPSGESDKFDFSSIMGNLPISSLGMSMGMQSENTMIILAILNSRTVMDSVAIKYNLQKRFRCKDLEKTVKILRERVSVEVEEEGTISMSVKMDTPWLLSKKNDEKTRLLSMEMANYFIRMTDQINKKLKTERAKNTRKFIEQRYYQNLVDLKNAEELLKEFQQKYGTIALPEQTTATINAAAQIKAEIISKGIEVNVIDQTIGQSNQNYLRSKHELDELNKEYSRLFNIKNMGNDNKKLRDVLLPISKIPDLGVQFARLYRDVLIQEKLLEFLLPQYEQAKIQEAKDTPTVQVLDYAIKPIKKSSPKRAILVCLSGFLTIISCFAYALTIENFSQMKQNGTDNYHKIEKISKTLRRRKL